MRPCRAAKLPLIIAVAVGLCVVAACGGSSPPGEPAASPSPSGDISRQRLESMLLQSSDLVGLTGRRAFAASGLTTQATPQLALCRPLQPVGPHEIANVIASSTRPGGVKVFEVLSAYADDAAAKAAYAKDVDAARRCTTYQNSGVAHRITGLAAVAVGAGTEAVHYAVVTSDVVSGDVRTYARHGRYTVLVSGFGASPTGQPLLAYQQDLMTKAVARLR
jgi:methylmalonyl-CoA mutase cobalamin-binding subunit